MNLRFLYPHWGSEQLSVSEFFAIVNSNKFDGIEINVPKDSVYETDFYDAVLQQRQFNQDFLLIVQQVLGVQKESPEEYLSRVMNRLEALVHYRPNFINSHTGKDHYSFDQNCRIIEAIESFSLKYNIPVYHEIHRGRFTFHSASIVHYLERFPDLRLVGDLSHWCLVSESMLQDQEDIIEMVIPHISHLHARVGFEQTPQVNNPFAPEWQDTLKVYLGWWQKILNYHKDSSDFTITPEFGPYPYMPQEPFTQRPLSIQSEVNIKMREYLIEAL